MGSVLSLVPAKRVEPAVHLLAHGQMGLFSRFFRNTVHAVHTVHRDMLRPPKVREPRRLSFNAEAAEKLERVAEGRSPAVVLKNPSLCDPLTSFCELCV